MTVPHSRSLGLLAHIGRARLIRTASCLLGLLNVSECIWLEDPLASALSLRVPPARALVSALETRLLT
jgi:hypothetical protein